VDKSSYNKEEEGEKEKKKEEEITISK